MVELVILWPLSNCGGFSPVCSETELGFRTTTSPELNSSKAVCGHTNVTSIKRPENAPTKRKALLDRLGKGGTLVHVSTKGAIRHSWRSDTTNHAICVGSAPYNVKNQKMNFCFPDLEKATPGQKFMLESITWNIPCSIQWNHF